MGAIARPKTGRRWYADLAGEDGNAWVIMGVVSRQIKDTLGAEEARLYGERARSGDYQNLLEVSREYVDIVDRGSGFVEIIDDDEEEE